MFITPDDLAPFATIDEAKAKAMIEDAEAQAVTAAPCLATAELPEVLVSSVRAILRRAILRWHETGTGVVQTEAAGPFSQTIDTTRSAPRGLYWPAEIVSLQDICRQATGIGGPGKAFSIDTTPAPRYAPYYAAYDGAPIFVEG